MFKSVNNCNNTEDFRNLAKKRLPSPISPSEATHNPMIDPP